MKIIKFNLSRAAVVAAMSAGAFSGAWVASSSAAQIHPEPTDTQVVAQADVIDTIEDEQVYTPKQITITRGTRDLAATPTVVGTTNPTVSATPTFSAAPHLPRGTRTLKPTPTVATSLPQATTSSSALAGCR